MRCSGQDRASYVPNRKLSIKCVDDIGQSEGAVDSRVFTVICS